MILFFGFQFDKNKNAAFIVKYLSIKMYFCFSATVIYSPVQIKINTQELNVIGQLNFSVETNVLELETLVIVAMTFLLSTKPPVITVAKNSTPPVKAGMETLHVKDKN